MTNDEFIQYKRGTEKGHTYYLKAKDAVEQEAQKVRAAFMNP